MNQSIRPNLLFFVFARRSGYVDYYRWMQDDTVKRQPNVLVTPGEMRFNL